MQDSTTLEVTATLIQAVATVVALAGVGVTFYFSFRAERRERRRASSEAERADASADRASRSAALTIDAMERIADAVEQLQHQGVLPAPAEPRVRWALSHFDGDTYMLQNIGAATAHDVHVHVDETLILRGDLPDGREMPEEDFVTFLALRTFGTRDDTITVEWSDAPEEDAERHSWRYPLPPRPPRR